ncbi:MAG TPA: hypothetical protein EYN28_07480 [Flavobacteriales bacterium]|jgi:hypothetical protein|nr:hypothetical protein [Flavobacteriales bacterium]HIB76355.1 hypothetical protein [Flavobacteriales bacterium]HIN42080.1 hypothetical protein [Flavobacteriales bacterium]HIO16770.1 hypothetical protein [Flavobacteriales bacterium]HIO60000.1 hypothetical protein [Flavobacteriales bacterium]
MSKSSFFLVKLPVISISIFLIFFIIAAYVFPGSVIEKINFSSDKYSLSHNFLSRLGGLKAGVDESNLVSALLFNSSLMLIGATLILFYRQFKEVFIEFEDDSKTLFYARLTKPVGIIAGVLFAGIGAIPYDVHLGAHGFSAKFAFTALFFLSILHSLTIYHSKSMSNRYSFGYIVFGITLLYYIYLLFFGPKISPNINYSESDLILQVIAQKSIVFTFIISIIIQVYGFKSAIKRSSDTRLAST